MKGNYGLFAHLLPKLEKIQARPATFSLPSSQPKIGDRYRKQGRDRNSSVLRNRGDARAFATLHFGQSKPAGAGREVVERIQDPLG
jgi:hypothetical protein